ncbi:hypothetical protein DAEQUDRAFT_170694 [Daedalea quercina L-15889]|uniref:Uncharacterized protein n=1 Tax=Daedalea quercina L-15889 TaxID=1314783 RepID=A0A165RK89_9APHY|nr:hypothetical protein DAEQUDRAFT_170694 [Daedalea quercina L-15889]
MPYTFACTVGHLPFSRTFWRDMYRRTQRVIAADVDSDHRCSTQVLSGDSVFHWVELSPAARTSFHHSLIMSMDSGEGHPVIHRFHQKAVVPRASEVMPRSAGNGELGVVHDMHIARGSNEAHTTLSSSSTMQYR